MDKLISVVIPTFDRQALTDRAVESVAPSQPEFFEIIVVDDCGTIPYAYNHAVNSGGVPVLTFRTAINAGPGLARRLGVERSRGCVIAFLDSDDVFEPGWPDAILAEVFRHGIAFRDSLFIAGSVLRGSPVQRWCIQLLASLSNPLRTLSARLATIAFNPFYTPATAISKQICTFLGSERHCEDYFTNAMAIFKAGKIVVLATTACTISRSPGTSGGLSELKEEMKKGEFHVRSIMMHSPSIPLYYRMLVPFGMAYAALRPHIKSILHFEPGYFARTNRVTSCDASSDTECRGENPRLAILGTRGIPARYGGFETFAEKLAIGLSARGFDVTVFCEAGEDSAPDTFEGVRLRYESATSLGPLRTVLFDLKCVWAARKGYDLVYMLGYGAAPFCLIPRMWGSRVWINPDGLEWARSKWNLVARLYFLFMEWVAVHVPNRLIADSEAIAASLLSRHGKPQACTVIEYGCEVIEKAPPTEPLSEWNLNPEGYYLLVCRLEPENHVLEILQAFQQSRSQRELIVVGDHRSQTPYVEQLCTMQDQRIRMIGTVYDQTRLISLRYYCFAYIHGHSVGGTNPSLLEAMGCGNNIFAHDNPFNRATLSNCGQYFADSLELRRIVDRVEVDGAELVRYKEAAKHRASVKFRWQDIVSRYAELAQRELSQHDAVRYS